MTSVFKILSQAKVTLTEHLFSKTHKHAFKVRFLHYMLYNIIFLHDICIHAFPRKIFMTILHGFCVIKKKNFTLLPSERQNS